MAYGSGLMMMLPLRLKHIREGIASRNLMSSMLGMHSLLGSKRLEGKTYVFTLYFEFLFFYLSISCGVITILYPETRCSEYEFLCLYVFFSVLQGGNFSLRWC